MMPEKASNFHATAIVTGTTGILFIGPSGSGKSSMAMAFLACAARNGLFSALVADDQVFLTQHGGRVIASRPASIASMIEIPGSGIGHYRSIGQAVMHCAIAPFRAGDSSGSGRLPPENETVALPCGMQLPLLRMALETADPLAVFMALSASSRAAT